VTFLRCPQIICLPALCFYGFPTKLHFSPYSPCAGRLEGCSALEPCFKSGQNYCLFLYLSSICFCHSSKPFCLGRSPWGSSSFPLRVVSYLPFRAPSQTVLEAFPPHVLLLPPPILNHFSSLHPLCSVRPSLQSPFPKTPTFIVCKSF